MAVTTILFIEFPELQIHLNPMIDSMYITRNCHFRLYFFFRRDFVVPLSHPLFDPAAPFLAILLYMAHPTPPLAALAASPPTSPPQVVPSLSPGDDDPSEVVDSSFGSSSRPGDGYAPVEPSMANGFLSSASD